MREISEDTKFQEMKQTLQKILNKYMPSGEHFSIEDFSKEQIWYICRLLLEKDTTKRKLIRNEIEGKLKNAMDEYKSKFYEIIKYKEIFDKNVGITGNLDDLVDDIETENKMDNDLNNF